MILNIEICVNDVNWIKIVLINRTIFYIEIDNITIILQCLSWPNTANIRIGVSFYYSFILVFF